MVPRGALTESSKIKGGWALVPALALTTKSVPKLGLQSPNRRENNVKPKLVKCDCSPDCQNRIETPRSTISPLTGSIVKIPVGFWDKWGHHWNHQPSKRYVSLCAACDLHCDTVNGS